MGFVRDWQKKLGYKHDPFQEKPTKKVTDFFVGRVPEQEVLNLFIIKQKKFGLLAGSQGTGKTTLVTWLEEQLPEKTLLLSGKMPRSEFFNKLMHVALNFVERTISKPHEKAKGEELQTLLLRKLARRELLLLIDDAGDLENDGKWLVKQILENCKKVSIILVVDKVLKDHEQYGEDQLKLDLSEMPEGDLELLLQRRIELAGGQGTWPFNHEEMEKLVSKAKNNPVKLLDAARDRAIELSLKVRGPPPKQVQRLQPRQTTRISNETHEASVEIPTTLEPEPQKEKRPWFKLVRNDEERIAYEQGDEQPSQVKASETAVEDAEELDSILSAALAETAPEEKVEKKETKTTPTHHTHKGPISHGRRRRGR